VTLWVVRAGENLSSLPLFERYDVIAIGWSELPRSPVGLTRPELSELMTTTYPTSSAATVSNYTGQVWHFVNTISPGDLVLVPLERSAAFRVAQVTGNAETRPELAGHCAAVRGFLPAGDAAKHPQVGHACLRTVCGERTSSCWGRTLLLASSPSSRTASFPWTSA